MLDPHGEEARSAVSNHEARIVPSRSSFETRVPRSSSDNGEAVAQG